MDEEKMTSVKKQLDEISRVSKKHWFTIDKFNLLLGAFLICGSIIISMGTKLIAFPIILAMYGIYLMYTSEKEINGCI